MEGAANGGEIIMFTILQMIGGGQWGCVTERNSPHITEKAELYLFIPKGRRFEIDQTKGQFRFHFEYQIYRKYAGDNRERQQQVRERNK